MQHLVKEYFTESIQTQIVITEALSQPIEHAAKTILNALLNGNKILSCGNGVAAANVSSFSTQIMKGVEIERPAIPAMTLVADSVFISSLNDSNAQMNDVYAKQIQALALPSDILIVLTDNGNEETIMRAVQEAVNKDMTIIALTGCDGGSLVGLLSSDDIEIRIPSNKKRMINEMQAMVLNCLCQLVENTLFIHK